MTVTTETHSTTAIAERLGVADETIAQLKDRYTGLTAETTAKYKQVMLAIADVRTVRVGVENSRKELKADALDYCRAVDAEAKRITIQLLAIEEPLKAVKAKVDEIKEQAKREKALAEQRRIEAELKAKQEAEEAERRRIEAIRLEEQKRIAEEQKAERERLEKLQSDLRKQQAEADAKRKEEEAKAKLIRQEQERVMQAERDRLRQEREALDRERFEAESCKRAEEEAQRKAQEAKEAAEQAERERIEKEAKIKALAPDADKLDCLARSLKSLVLPTCSSPEASDIVDYVSGELLRVAGEVDSHVRRLSGKSI